MLNNSRLFFVLLSALSSAACTTFYEEKNNMEQEPGALDVILCEQPRPQICTREYDPVCAKLNDGSIRTYATGCTSCADSKVESYTKGACELVLLNKPDIPEP